MTIEVQTSEATKRAILKALNHLPSRHLNDLLRFIQFLEFKATITPDDSSEDDALWDAVQANREYRQQNPDEKLEKYDSGEDFLKAVADL